MTIEVLDPENLSAGIDCRFGQIVGRCSLPINKATSGSVVDHWQDAARNAGIYGADIDITSGAFAAHATHHAVARG